MRFAGFIGASYMLQSVNVDCQRCINLYPEMDEAGTGNEGEIASLVATPGLKLLCTLPTGPVRGTYTDSTGQLWAVGGNVLYKISNVWQASAIGTLATSTGPVSFSDNGIQAVVVDGPYGYYWTFSSAGNNASGTITASATTNPLPNDTITIGGTTITYVSGTPTGNQVQIAFTPNLTMRNLLTFLKASTDPNITQCSYTLTNNDFVLTITANALGLSGNSITIASSSLVAFTLSGPTLSGGGGVSSFTQINDANFLGATQVDYIDGYFIFSKQNSQQFFLSPLNAVVPFSGLDVGTAEAQPENLMGLIELQEQVYLFSGRHIEVWYDSGAASFPFQRIPSGVIEIGCAAAFSIAKIQNAVYWLGQDKDGRAVVYRMQGMQPQRISTYAIENEIQGLPDLSGARAWTYQQSGHAFYCLNLPGANTTWVFDTTTNLWHERSYLASGQYQRHLVDCHAFAYNTNVGGDYSSGKLYALDPSTYTDNGNAICRERSAPHLSKDMMRLFHSRFQLDMEAGVGLNGTGQGVDPKVMLQWSNDYGNTWSNEHWTSAGKIGQRRKRMIWRRLGQSRDRVYRVRITDPVKVTLLGAEIDVEGGAA